MLEHFLDFHPVFGFLLHDLEDEVLGLWRHIDVLRELDFILHDAVEVQLRVDPEGNLAQDALVGHHPDRPDIYLLVVLCLHDHFRRVVEWAPADCPAHTMSSVDCPPEVTYLHAVLP